ncbi:hypothetical protein ACFWTE_02440 [Nocardiopsis sp. NPDC058631]|uniref:hypothetical protein n=1 Tax=Nocardiopsis sp. NPDC058631 TaxID=3346566 RepID=UPI00366270FB
MPGRLTPARFFAFYELGADPGILGLRDTVSDQRRREWLIGAELVERCETPDRGHAFRVTKAGLAVLREHLEYLEGRERARLPHRSGDEYRIQHRTPYSRAQLDAALARRARGGAVPPAGSVGADWRLGQGTQAWSGSPCDVLAAVAVLEAAGHTPVVFVGGWHGAGGPRGFYVEPRAQVLYVYHVEAGRSAREDGGWFTAEVGAYADALRAAGWHVEPGASRCVHVRAPGGRGRGLDGWSGPG